jgi:hypothetical protein
MDHTQGIEFWITMVGLWLFQFENIMKAHGEKKLAFEKPTL